MSLTYISQAPPYHVSMCKGPVESRMSSVAGPRQVPTSTASGFHTEKTIYPPSPLMAYFRDSGEMDGCKCCRACSDRALPFAQRRLGYCYLACTLLCRGNPTVAHRSTLPTGFEPRGSFSLPSLSQSSCASPLPYQDC